MVAVVAAALTTCGNATVFAAARARDPRSIDRLVRWAMSAPPLCPREPCRPRVGMIYSRGAAIVKSSNLSALGFRREHRDLLRRASGVSGSGEKPWGRTRINLVSCWPSPSRVGRCVPETGHTGTVVCPQCVRPTAETAGWQVKTQFGYHRQVVGVLKLCYSARGGRE